MRTSYSFEEKYQAIVEKNPAFEGLFFTAVKTTGIFCRPVCTARKPKPGNVVFYESTDDALSNGFRPCKVCKPTENSEEMPAHIRELVAELSTNPDLRLKDYDLKQRGIEPSHLRRWFKKNHNMSFQAYQRMLRINSAYHKISAGDTVTASAFDTGFNSLSGFNDSFRSVFGNAPKNSSDKSVINIVRFTTPLGPMFACATEAGVCLLEFTTRRMLETEFKDLTRLLNAVILPGDNQHLDQVQHEIAEYFEGKRKEFTVALDTPGTEFQNKVWTNLIKIPYGETRSYKQQAINMNMINSVRPVASANGRNRVSIIIPCHRVIGEDGSLTGYGGGLPRKQWLLDFEKKNGLLKAAKSGF